MTKARSLSPKNTRAVANGFSCATWNIAPSSKVNATLRKRLDEDRRRVRLAADRDHGRLARANFEAECGLVLHRVRIVPYLLGWRDEEARQDPGRCHRSARARGLRRVPAPAFGGRFAGERLERMHRSPQFIDGRFQNTPPQITGGSFRETVRLYRQGQIREPQFELPGDCAVAGDAQGAGSRRPARNLVRSLQRAGGDRRRAAHDRSRTVRRRLASAARTEAHARAADRARGPFGHRRRADLARSLRSSGHADDSATSRRRGRSSTWASE